MWATRSTAIPKPVSVDPRLTFAVTLVPVMSRPRWRAAPRSALLKHAAYPAAKRLSGLALGFATLPGLPSGRSMTPSSLLTVPSRPPTAVAEVV